MKHLLRIILIVVLTLFASCALEDKFTREEVRSYAKDLGIDAKQLYFIRPELQQEYMDMGQPNAIVLNWKMDKLLAATCYEEFPYYLDKFNEFKSQVNDTLTMYDSKFNGHVDEIFKTIDSNDKLALDPNKKYYMFYYFAKYGEEMDKKLKPGIEKYKDSVQYFFINVDKMQQ
jgi:hypothetical protein